MGLMEHMREAPYTKTYLYQGKFVYEGQGLYKTFRDKLVPATVQQGYFKLALTIAWP